MKLFTIGFTKKTAEEFFNILVKNNVKILIDIRRNNKSQLAGFAKGVDLKYFLKKIANIDYIYFMDFAPSHTLLENYQKKKINWEQYEEEYLKQLNNYENWDFFNIEKFENGCLLCSEETPLKCHRRLLAEFLMKKYHNMPIELIHL
ncbi:MAG TPA: DUF488 domain-containing protein [candidate division Zixibacteria bacterium]|nr:DUF488 domain-containing protein [candidate division Zixibacteria bacterium]